MITLNIELTEDEASYLCGEMNIIMRSYKRSYCGEQFDNESMGSAFNKVFKALSGRDHEQYLKFHKT